ncbi:MAG: phosphate transport system regulatory protein PhoU [Chloroflexi bacterium]|nr:phosphate transport system regulatory protein PhoU [Chloroflexota bacterium]|tara:strand:+ start:14700 stop:15398 length:699 start_codon:yes stop_codon:yes gene_type:complete
MANYHGRKSLDLGLLEIETKINALDLRILEVFENTFTSFYEKDLEKSKKVIENDYLINQASLEIENNSIDVIRRETPLASDMRKLTSYMFVSQELERIGDYLSGICKINLKIGKEPFITKFEKIPKMEAIAKNMLKDSIKLFSNIPDEEKAIIAARKIFSQDDEIDYLNYQVQNDLIKRMSRNSKLVEQGTYIIWVAHNLERISDRANNIAERTIYVITGDSGAIVPYELEE